jgi:lysophospholipase
MTATRPARTVVLRPILLVVILMLILGGGSAAAADAGNDVGGKDGGGNGLGAAVVATLETPDGGFLRHAWWPAGSGAGAAAARGTVVLLPGRCEPLEQYREIAEDWVGRGYQVFSLDWRGQGLSSRFLADRQKCHVPDYALHVSDMTRWLDTVVKPHEVGPTILFAHSMGGLIALRFLLEQPDRFAAVVLSAPMVDINTDPWPRFAAEMVARVAVAFGLSGGYAFGQGAWDPAVDGVFENNPVTGDPVRFRRLPDAYRANPDLILGGVTFGWLVASFRTQAVVAIPGALQDVRVPVLLLVAPQDRLVPAETQELLCRRLHDCTVRRYPEARHNILAERDDIRSRAWQDIDAFLARVPVP